MILYLLRACQYARVPIQICKSLVEDLRVLQALDDAEVRITGCLIEKSIVSPNFDESLAHQRGHPRGRSDLLDDSFDH